MINQHMLVSSAEMDATEDKINLRIYPSYHNKLITQFTMGDLHGNAIKLIYTLVRNGICQLISDEPQKIYSKLISIYESPEPLSQENFFLFNHIIDNYLLIIDTKTLVRFIGDCFADRGKNDWFTLKVIYKLKHAGVNFRTVLSNHDCRFLCAMGLNGAKADINAIKAKSEDKQNADSFFGLKKTINAGLVRLDEVLAMLRGAYLPSLVMLDFSLNSCGVLSIFTHAPCDLKSIKDLSNQFGTLYEDATNEDLVNTINAINHELDFCIQHDLLGLVLKKDTPAYDLMWMREKKLMLLRNNIETREVKNIIFIYGHDKKSLNVPQNVIRIDNYLGRGDLGSGNEKNISYLSNEPVSLKTIFSVTNPNINKIYAREESELISIIANRFKQRLERESLMSEKIKINQILKNLNALLESNKIQTRQNINIIPSFLLNLSPQVYFCANTSICLITLFALKKVLNTSMLNIVKHSFYGVSMLAGLDVLGVFAQNILSSSTDGNGKDLPSRNLDFK